MLERFLVYFPLSICSQTFKTHPVFFRIVNVIITVFSACQENGKKKKKKLWGWNCLQVFLSIPRTLRKVVLALGARFCSESSKRWSILGITDRKGRRGRKQKPIREDEALRKSNHFSQMIQVFPCNFLFLFNSLKRMAVSALLNFFLLLWQMTVPVYFPQNWALSQVFICCVKVCSHGYVSDYRKVNFKIGDRWRFSAENLEVRTPIAVIPVLP